MSALPSLRDLLRTCPKEKLAEVLASLTEAECDTALHDFEGIWARLEQLAPTGDWRTWLIMSGRGWGKTRTGAEWVRTQLLEMPGCRVAIVARTYADARDTCVEGESGLLACFSEAELEGHTWNRSIGEGSLANGSSWRIFSSEEPSSLRGPQFHVLWADELAAWKKSRAAWAQVPFVVRLPWHVDPKRAGRVLVTTTPKPCKELRDLISDKTTHLTRGSSFDNWRHLNELTRAQLRRLKGTRIGRQELEGEMLEDTPGALWTRALLERQRVTKAPVMVRVLVGVDPATSSHEDSDETGIIVAGRARPVGKNAKGHRYVLDDRSLRGKPHEWATAALAAYRHWQADAIVVEVNNGGEMCAATIHAVDPSVRVISVHASRGKVTRAEPIATAYEAGEVWHVGAHERLEDQLCTWTQDSDESPDRLDAGVWALTALDGSEVGDIPTELPEAPQRGGLAGMSM